MLKPSQRASLIGFAAPLVAARVELERLRHDEEADLAEVAWKAIRKAGLDDALAAETDLKARDKLLEAAQEVCDAFAAWRR